MVPALEAILAKSKNLVFFGGAGVSTESGIPDFRSVDGLYHQKFRYPPEVMLSHSFYESHTAEFFDFYRNKLIVHGAKPNAAHLRLAQLEQQARSGQPISLMDLAAAVHREEREKKKSVMEQLKSQPKTEHKKTAQKKSAEREL